MASLPDLSDVIAANDADPLNAPISTTLPPRKAAELATASTSVLAIGGMTCAACVRKVEKALGKVPGVSAANVNLVTERASVTYDPASVSDAQLVAAVERVGYEAGPLTPQAVEDATATEAERRARELKQRRDRLALGVALSLPILILSMFFMHAFAGEDWLLLALTLPVWGYVGADFHRGAWRALRHRTTNMDVLVLEDFILLKSEQPQAKQHEIDEYMAQFELD